MNYLQAFDISGSGMAVEKLRLDVTAINLANVHTTRTAEGNIFKPLQVLSTSHIAPSFETTLNHVTVGNAPIVEVIQKDTPPRLVYDPGHPAADEKGFVAYPDINPVAEMINLITTTRAYEANVRAINAAKTMALKALEIGGA